MYGVTRKSCHFLFTEDSFDFGYDSGKTFAKSAKSFDSFAILSSPVAVARSLFRSFSLTESLGEAILSSRNDAFRNICSLHSPSFWVDLPRTVCGSVCLSEEKITPFVNTPPSTSTSWNKGWAFMKGLRYSPLHVTEFCGEMQGKFKVSLALLTGQQSVRFSSYFRSEFHFEKKLYGKRRNPFSAFTSVSESIKRGISG